MLLLVSQYILTTWPLGKQREYHERLGRALLGTAQRVGSCLEMRTVEGSELQLDGESNSEIVDGGATGSCAFQVAASSSICQLPAAARSSWSLMSVFRACVTDVYITGPVSLFT